MQHIIYDNDGGNDENVANYMECWIAQMIQYPAEKSICPTIISNQGAGKGTFLKIIAAMIGPDKYFETVGHLMMNPYYTDSEVIEKIIESLL
jgi:ABC-type Na+ transport system ATPase subunit NatA